MSALAPLAARHSVGSAPDQVPAVNVRRGSLRRWARTHLVRLAPVLIPLFIIIHTGRIGIDFGYHWDEHLQLRLVARTVKTGVLVPGVYNYPTLSYWLTLATAGPKVARAYRPPADLIQDLNTMRSLEVDNADLQKYVLEDKALFLRVRAVFLIVSSLTALWVYLLVLTWRRHVGEAFLAASLLALSWEFAYHARWLAPDAVMTSFAALAVLLMSLAAHRPDGRGWLRAAAVAVGLATGTKYQCGLLVLPLLIVAARVPGGARGGRAYLRRVVGLGVLCFLTFLFTTPALLLDTGRVLAWLRYVALQYGGGDHGAYNVRAGPVHLGKMAAYLGGDFFSHYPPVAIGAALSVMLGGWALLRESRRWAVAFLVFPVVYLGYMGVQRVMIVRNLLVVSPFLAVLAARGFRFVFVWARPRWLRCALGIAAASALTANAAWLYAAARSIPDASTDRAVGALISHLKTVPSKQVYASGAVRSHLINHGFDMQRLADKAEDAREWVFFPNDMHTRTGAAPSNVTWLSRRWFGPYELNWNYYTDWIGFQRIVSAPAARLSRLGVYLDQPPPLPAAAKK